MSHPAPVPGKISADKLVANLAAGTLPAGATNVYEAADALPAVLVKVKDAIGKDPGTSVWDILLGAIRNDIVFRPEFKFATGAWDAKRDKVFRGMSSGTSEYAFDLPKLNLAGFFADMFVGIVRGHPATAIYEFDLFHGHVVPNEAGRDVVIVFHAKEYPSDVVNQFQMQKYSDAHLLTPGKAPFTSKDALMDERNFVWTLSTNKVFLLNGAIRHKDLTSEFVKLMDLDGTGKLPPDVIQIGTVQEKLFGPELFTVNYFPTLLAGDPTTQVFINPVGRWGVLKHLETKYPKIPPAEITDIYEKSGDSLATTDKELAERSAKI